ncbi:MAG: hypothetical protein ABIP97_01050 [Chthoniobacterales bacterium]
MKVFLAALIVTLVSTICHAELPPSAYEAKQAAATQQLKIQILRVNIEPGDKADTQKVEALARVDQVIRTNAQIKLNDLITIIYTVTHHPSGWAGPGEIPILQENQSLPAYLTSIPESKNFAPAAGRMSFINF